jgi:hypothetical protein
MKRLPLSPGLTVLAALALLLAGVFGTGISSAAAQQASAQISVSAVQKDAPVIAPSTHAQHALADLVSARIRAGLRGQPYRVEQSCANDDCVISIHP